VNELTTTATGRTVIANAGAAGTSAWAAQCS
jgi:hypothetical protein